MKPFTVKLLIVFLLFVSAASEAVPSANKTTSVKFDIPVLTVHPENGGAINHLPFTFERTNTDESLKIILANDTPDGAGARIRGSVWLATVTAAMFRKDPMNGVRITVEFSGDVDGPSAGGVMCLSVLSAMAGRQIPDDFAMTGTIMPDGTIGVVGGVAQKVNAAIQRGCKRICIPRYPRFETQDDGSVVDLFTLGADKNVTVKPVQNIDEVYSFLYGVRREIKVADEFALCRIPKELEKFYTGFTVKSDNDIKTIQEKYKGDVLEAMKSDSMMSDLLFGTEKYVKDFFNGRLISATGEAWFRSAIWSSLPKWFEYMGELAEKEPLFFKKPPHSPADQIKILEAIKKANGEINLLDQKISNKIENARSKKGYVRPSGDINGISCWWECTQDGIIADLRALSFTMRSPDDDSLNKTFAEKDGRDEFLENEKKKIIYRKYFLILLERYLKNPSNIEFEKTVSRCYKNIKTSPDIPKVEKLFYSAWRALDATLTTDVINTYAETYGCSSSEIKSFFIQHDILYTSYLFRQGNALTAHALLGKKKSLTDYECHVTATLSCNVAILAEACALFVKYSPDCGSMDAEGNYVCTNRQFLTYLVRRARESALSSIDECARAGLPCIPALQFFEEAESVGLADVSANDLIHDVLKNYWQADLTARAIMMSFKVEK